MIFNAFSVTSLLVAFVEFLHFVEFLTYDHLMKWSQAKKQLSQSEV